VNYFEEYLKVSQERDRLALRVSELESKNQQLQEERDALYRDCPGV